MIPMVIEIGPEFQCLQWKDKPRIPVFIRIGPAFPLFIKIGLQTECLDGEAKNSIVYKGRDRTPMFRRIRKEFQCL